MNVPLCALQAGRFYIGHARRAGSTRKMTLCRELPRNGGGRIRILSPPVPLLFCFEAAGDMMNAAERAVCTLQVLSSFAVRIGRCFFLCVTVRYSERIAARCLFSEYGTYIGAGRCLAAYAAEQAERYIPDAVAQIGTSIIKR